MCREYRDWHGHKKVSRPAELLLLHVLPRRRKAPGERVEVSRRAARVIGGEQHAAYDDELIGIERGAQPGQPTLYDLERQKLLSTSAFRSGAILQVDFACTFTRHFHLCSLPCGHSHA